MYNYRTPLNVREKSLLTFVILIMISSIVLALGIGFIMPYHMYIDGYVAASSDADIFRQCQCKYLQ